MTDKKSVVAVTDHSSFDFRKPVRNAKANATLPPVMIHASFAELMAFIFHRIMPPLIARGGFDFEVSAGYYANARFNPRLPGFGFYVTLEFSLFRAPEEGLMMMRDTPKQTDAELAKRIKEQLH